MFLEWYVTDWSTLSVTELCVEIENIENIEKSAIDLKIQAFFKTCFKL